MIKIGIDVYLKWDMMTDKEESEQYTGFSVTSGDKGYLREAYHGDPYATAVLIQEDWEGQPEGGFSIPSSVLEERLPHVRAAAIERSKVVYDTEIDEDSPEVKAFDDFVKLHRKLEDDGLNPRIIISY